MFRLGTSLIPNKGNQTQNIPAKTSVRDNKVNSAACKNFDFKQYNINPEQTKNPCKEDRDEFLNEINILSPLKIRTIIATRVQKRPPIATVVNFGVFFRHLRVTVYPANPSEDNSPFIKPNNVPPFLLSNDINIIPIAAIEIENNVGFDIFSFKKM